MKKAVALRYDSELPAPFIVGNAAGEVVERLLDIARDYGIPVVEDDDLVRTLFFLNPGDYIPPEVYTIVAEIYIFVRDLQGKA